MNGTGDVLARADQRLRYVTEGWFPLRREVDGTVTVVVAGTLPPGGEDAVAAAVGGPVDLRPARRHDIAEAVMGSFSAQIADEAAMGLHRRTPDLSARTVLVGSQRWLLGISVAVLMTLWFVWPRATLTAVLGACGLAFTAGIAFKFWVSLRGARYDLVETVTREDLDLLEEAGLPRYTILVPVFREANIVGELVHNLREIEYPVDRLEVLVLVEEEDHLTRAAVEESQPPDNFVIVTVPRGTPQTKPRACNVGLQLASGEYVVIYDAEDIPDPLQLKKALLAFQRSGETTICVQAALNYFNANENVLTRLFALEYSYWFDYMLAGLDREGLPIPLGGTSNHFRTAALRELGGWDPFNVTEDADLGIRASALGYRVGVVDSTTMEEANTQVPNFIRQRSRWIKGYMMTTLVHARKPFTMFHQLGLRRFSAFLLLITGTPLIFLGVLPLLAMAVLTLVVPLETTARYFPLPVLWLSLFNFLIGSGLMVYLNMMGPYKRGQFSLVFWALLNPAYWVLHSIAAYKALWQLATRPHYWEKTEHGLTQQAHPSAVTMAEAPL